MPEQLEKVLSIQQLSRRFGSIQAVNNLSLEVIKGQVFGILGPNGSGKTTTLSILLGLIKADHGTFLWFGQDSSPETRRRIGSVIESPNFYPYLTARQNLRILCDIKKKPADDIDRVLKLTDLHHRRNHHFRTYSFGMKQRLAIASALLGNPEMLILDEPTNGLDPQGIAQIREIIGLVAREGITIILASHLLDEVQKICSHVAVLDKGKKLYDGSVLEVLSVTDSFELASGDIEKLAAVLQAHPSLLSADRFNDKVIATFNPGIDAAGLNVYLYSKGVILSHLMERKRTLEQHFLELLQQNQ
jgi:ABC-2 type transport system ATP-binding protein